MIIHCPISSVKSTENTYYSGVETYVIVNDSLPDANADNISMATIYECTNATDYSKYNYGDSLAADWTFDAALGNFDLEDDGDDSDDLCRVLFKVRLSDVLPDSFIVTEAYVELCMDHLALDVYDGGADATPDSMVINLYRLFQDWTEGSSSNAHEAGACSWDTVTAATAWGTAGADDDDHGDFHLARWNLYDKTTKDGLGIHLAFGTDTLNTANGVDRTHDPIISYTIYRLVGETPAAATNDRWLKLDITEFVRNWHNGKWANYGFIMISPAESDAEGAYAILYGDEDFTGGMYARRPRVTIKGILVSTSAGGTGTSLGGKSGI